MRPDGVLRAAVRGAEGMDRRRVSKVDEQEVRELVDRGVADDRAEAAGERPSTRTGLTCC